MSQNSQNSHILKPPTYARLPRPIVARVDDRQPGAFTPWHSHDWWQLTWAQSGVLAIETRQGSFMAPPARAIWIPPDTEHQATNVALTEMRSLYVARELMNWAAARCRVVSITPLVRELILALSSLPADYDEAGAAGRLVQVLIDQLQHLPEVAFNLPMPVDPRLVRICSALQANPDDSRSVPEWSQLAGLSERSLSRLFMQQTGLSFGDWRQRLRLLLALARLERGERVNRVALDSGYNSPSAFIAAFRRNFGVTPMEMFRDPAPVAET
ncbi:helix-turn-helix transcriptional regulator [Uliginosibacterium sp. 31-16]|uniref:AraC family transcriptional regulator n=1 Tax=Uliginosibacterium sp. 31-16 TaxID=3068315 RepID=UPI00273E9AB8|nr:helix-turn-helix transcriptional regulator [Uliginosibacterium sp. 31-16]MDP5240502.1 helix-turn-helix transcriptional regulator [Uliginosibacterium sp. 31-16]